jgi:C-terminal processing protease CtpA/Prc
MKNMILPMCLLYLSSYAQTVQIAPKYIDSIFAQDRGIEIFFYKKDDNKSNFLQKQNLINALTSQSVKVELANQLGVFFANDSYKILSIDNNSVAAKLGLKVGDSLMNFGGIELSNSYLGPFHEDFYSGKTPSFMLTIKREGNTIELGGGIKDLPVREWGDDFLKKYYPQGIE